MHWESDIRIKALARRDALGLPADALAPADDILAVLQQATGLGRSLLLPGDSLLLGAQAVLDLGLQVIFQDGSLPLTTRRFDAAHEYAHFWLHGGSCHCAASDLQTGNDTDGLLPIEKVDGYSPAQRREGEANAYATELLLPSPLCRRLFLDEGWPAFDIARHTGLSANFVQAQLARCVLLPPPLPKTPAQPKVDRGLDPFQQAAAEIAQGPLLLGAGPGTGKTQTLLGRCRYLTQTRAVTPEKILALTFSRDAAGEMRARLAQAGVASGAAGPWVGTFHSFGLEILRRYGAQIGLPSEIKLLSGLDALTLLENNLALLQLDALDNLYNPAIHLRGILGQISRAKDELCPPEQYETLCQRMGEEAAQAAQEFSKRAGKKLKKDEEVVERALSQAAKAKEVARCYQIYEQLKTQHGYLDFADLIFQAVGLLETRPDLCAALQADYPHVLADEYQDVNRGCARLVKMLAGDRAEGLWAVGDHRQSIYRFRGASPANVAAFSRDYPNGTRLELGVNYRSQQPIVDCFGAAAGKMTLDDAGDAFTVWQANREKQEAGSPASVTLAVSPDEEGQAMGMARAIKGFLDAGWQYRDQAILCRTHAQARRLVALLTTQDVPILYLGPLLDRPEIKDLLCLLSLFGDGDGSGLLRLASLPEYAVSREDVLLFLAQLRVSEQTPLQALQASDLPDGLARLAAQVGELAAIDDPADLLRHYLFGQSDFLRYLTAPGETPFAILQKQMAVSQFLALAQTFDQRLVAPKASVEPPQRIRDFLAHLQRLTQAGESPQGAMPDGAEALDAVRLLTAHKAKGLEYPIVFLPNLGQGQFPSRGRHDGIPEPPGLADLAGSETDEDDCLFFVALSRARDHLIVSRAETNGTDKAVAPSPLLALIQSWLDAHPESQAEWPSGLTKEAPEDALLRPLPLPVYSASALELYERCPRQYFYERELKLAGRFVGGGYPQFHACVRQTLTWLEDQRAAGQTLDSTAAQAKLDEIWADGGPLGHVHEQKYRDSANEMLQHALSLHSAGEERLPDKTLYATLTNCRVRIRPDLARVAKDDGAIIVGRHLTGKPGAGYKTEKRLALIRRAASETHPTRPVRLQIRYLATGTVEAVEPPATDYKAKLEADRLLKYERAAQGIQFRRFPAQPGSADECQTCAFALICPI